MYFGNLPEEFLFILIDPDEQSLAIKNDQILELGLAGATLIELVIQGRLSTKEDLIFVVDETPVEDELMQQAFSLIRDSDRTSLIYWLRRIAAELPLKEVLLQRMVNKELITIEEEKRFFIFTTEKYDITRPDVELIIQQHIRGLVDSKEESSPRALGFLSLIYGTGATGRIFSSDEIEEHLSTIRGLVGDEDVGKGVAESIQIIIDALMRSQIVNYSSYMM